MKLLIILFSFYILLLPAVPCTDDGGCAGEDAATGTAAATGHSKQQNEACNPFCSCACCGQVFSAAIQLGKPAVVKTRVKKQQYFYKSISFASNYWGNIWQPPKA